MGLHPCCTWLYISRPTRTNPSSPCIVSSCVRPMQLDAWYLGVPPLHLTRHKFPSVPAGENALAAHLNSCIWFRHPPAFELRMRKSLRIVRVVQLWINMSPNSVLITCKAVMGVKLHKCPHSPPLPHLPFHLLALTCVGICRISQIWGDKIPNIPPITGPTTCKSMLRCHACIVPHGL